MNTSHQADAPCSDLALLTAVGAGDANALEELYDRYALHAYSLAMRMLGEPVLAEECVHAAFLEIREYPRHDGGSPVFADQLMAVVHKIAARQLHQIKQQRRAAGNAYLSHEQLAG